MAGQEKFIELFEYTKQKLEFLDDLEGVLAYPEYFNNAPVDKMPSLASGYTGNGWGILNEMLEVAGVEDVGVPKKMEDIDEADLQEFIYSLAQLKITDEIKVDEEKVDEFLAEKIWDVAIAMKAPNYEIVSILNFEMTLKELYDEAKDGNQEALLNLLRIDKTILYEDWVKELVVRKQLVGDWAFFEKLGKAVAKAPIKAEPSYLRVVILVGMFWETEFKNWTIEDLNEFLVDQELLAKNSQPENLQRVLHRANIKKYSREQR